MGRGANYAGASHGGIGSPGNGAARDVAATYGDTHAPTTPGSGGTRTESDESGGGVVRIVAAGAVTIDGVIDTDALDSNYSHARGGSGGSIYITCSTFRGSGGILTAEGGRGNRSGGSGGGGRIAVHYDVTAQSAVPLPGVTFSVRGAKGGSSQRGGNIGGRHGTLSFPDMQFFESGVLDTRWDYVDVYVPGVSEWTFPSLVVSGKIAFPEINPLRVAGDATIQGSGELTLHGGPTNAANPLLPAMRMLLDGDLTAL